MQELSRRRFLAAAAGVGALGAVRRLPWTSPGDQGSDKAEPSGPPPLTVTRSVGDTAPGVLLLTPTPSAGYQHGPLILDSSGTVVWFKAITSIATNLQVQSYKSEPVLTWWEGDIVLPGYGVGEYVLMDSSYREIKRVRAANGLSGDLHEFVLTPEGTALLTIFQEEPYDLSAYGGSADGSILNSLFQEVDLATGELKMQWSAIEHVSLTESYKHVPKSKPYDFFHINSIDVDPTDGNLIVSSRHLWCVLKIDRSTGKIIWRLHGKLSDFVMEPGSRFFWQHHARRHGADILTLFDDGAASVAKESRSRGLKLLLDERSMRAKVVRQYLPHPSELATSQGSTQVLPDGHVLVGWGDLPNLSEYTAGGRMIYNATLPEGINTYRALRSEWSGTTTA